MTDWYDRRIAEFIRDRNLGPGEELEVATGGEDDPNPRVVYVSADRTHFVDAEQRPVRLVGAWQITAHRRRGPQGGP
jgi:hypothetical protein